MNPGQITAFSGINNRLPKDRLDAQKGPAFVHDAENVDLNAAGRFQRRAGYQRVLAGESCRCLWTGDGSLALFAQGAELHRFDGSGSTLVAELASNVAHVAYAATPLGVAWSDGFTLNLLRDGVSAPIAPSLPNPLPTAAAAAGGGLRAGIYGVCFATRLPSGQRSPMSLPAYVQVEEGGHIEISSTGHVLPVEYFVTTVNGEVFYRAGIVAVGATGAQLFVAQSDGQPIVHQVMGPLPPGSILAHHFGRLLSASGPVVSYSLPYEMGVHRPASDYLPLPGNVALLASVEAGLFVATDDETWFLPGGDISASNMVSRAPFGAVRGTLATVPNSNDLMWFSPRGAVRAMQDGSIRLMQDQHMAFGPSQSGASLFREDQGMRTLITALSGSKPSGGAVVGGYIEATVVAL